MGHSETSMRDYFKSHPNLKFVFFGGTGGVGPTVAAGVSAPWLAGQNRRSVLAATGLWAGSAAAAPAPSGVTGASAAFTGPASGAAASAITKLSIGGALLAHKTITVAGATIISLATGLGFGRLAARLSPEQAGGRLPSADSARVAELEARLRNGVPRPRRRRPTAKRPRSPPA